jgi:hypothetical protein
MEKLRLVERHLPKWAYMTEGCHLWMSVPQQPPATIMIDCDPQGARLVHTMGSDSEAIQVLAKIVDTYRLKQN